jgi:hypothetical protein
MANLTLVRAGAERSQGAGGKTAKELKSPFSALERKGGLDADSIVASYKSRQLAFAELRGLINNGPAEERAKALEAIAELSREGGLRVFVELAIPIMCSIDPGMGQDEKKAISEMLEAVAGTPDEDVAASGFEAGIRARLLGLVVRFQDFLFRNDFFLEAKTGLFESASRSLMRANPERALRILLNQLKELNYECRQFLSSRAFAEGLEGDEIRSRAEWMDAVAEIGRIEGVSRRFAEAARREGEAFKMDVERRAKIAEEVSKVNPMARIVQLTSLAKLVVEAQAALVMMDISEAREIHCDIANARALIKELNA